MKVHGPIQIQKTQDVNDKGIVINNNRPISGNESFKYVPTAFKKVAQGMETQFSEFMLNQMRKGTLLDEDDSSSMDYYKDLMDTETAQAMAKKEKGVGIQKVILDQMYPENLRTKENFEIMEKKFSPQLTKKKAIANYEKSNSQISMKE